MKKQNIKKFFIASLGIMAPISMISIIAASCNNNKNNSDNTNAKNDKTNTVDKDKKVDSNKKEKEDHSKHNHLNKDETDKKETEDNKKEEVKKSALVEKVDKLESSDNDVAGLDVKSINHNDVTFLLRLTKQIEPNKEVKLIVRDESGNDTEHTSRTNNTKKTRVIEFDIKNLNPNTKYNVVRVVLDNKRSNLSNRTIPFETENRLPPLPVAEGNDVNVLVTNLSNTFGIIPIESNKNAFIRTLDLKFENFEKIKGKKFVINLRSVGTIDKGDTGSGDEVESEPTIINDDGTAQVRFTNSDISWRTNYQIFAIKLVLNEPDNSGTEAENELTEEDYVSSEKVYSTPLSLTNGDKTINITKIQFQQDDIDTGNFTLTFDAPIEREHLSKILIKTKQLSEAVESQGGYAFKQNKGQPSSTLEIPAYDLDFSAENPIEEIKFGDTTIRLSEDQKIAIPVNPKVKSSVADNPSTNNAEENEELKKISFNFQSGLTLKAGYHPTHYFLPKYAISYDGPEEIITSENISINKFIYDQYEQISTVNKDKDHPEGYDSLVMSLLKDEDPIFNIESNLFMSVKLKDVTDGSNTKDKVYESSLAPIASNGSADIKFMHDTEQALNFNNKYEVLEINVWRKAQNSEEKTLIKKFTPQEEKLSLYKYGLLYKARP